MPDTFRHYRLLLSDIYDHVTSIIWTVLTPNLLKFAVSLTVHLTVKVKLIRTQCTELRKITAYLKNFCLPVKTLISWKHTKVAAHRTQLPLPVWRGVTTTFLWYHNIAHLFLAKFQRQYGLNATFRSYIYRNLGVELSEVPSQCEIKNSNLFFSKWSIWICRCIEESFINCPYTMSCNYILINAVKTLLIILSAKVNGFV
jgi:hypothetical protein